MSPLATYECLKTKETYDEHENRRGRNEHCLTRPGCGRHGRRARQGASQAATAASLSPTVADLRRRERPVRVERDLAADTPSDPPADPVRAAGTWPGTRPRANSLAACSGADSVALEA